MIAGQLKHWQRYFEGPLWERAFEYIMSLGPDAEEGITELVGKDMFARVMGYDTVERELGKVEAHREYVDIQASLWNGERIDWFPLEGLEPINEYNPVKDATNYMTPGESLLTVANQPGTFVVFFPEDAHMPKLAIAAPLRVKKVVIKIRLSSLS